jgi:NAD(P)-dependent dehydrogenase (short-subunit alcohol dehydrogenase family)
MTTTTSTTTEALRATPFGLTGRRALVTGGSRGLGRSIAAAYAQAGAEVVVCSRKQESCDETAAELSELYGTRVVGRACHVGSWDQVDEVVEWTESELGPIDILVNNAGMSPLYESEDQVTEALFDKVFDVNLKGAFRLTANVGARMMAREQGGSIINISSIAADYPHKGLIPYAAAKAALEAITTGFARTYGPKVRVNAIQPGSFLTDVSHHWDMEAFAERSQGFALRRGGQPDEIQGAALYLASDASSFTTGAILRVDGGEF